MLCQFTLDTLLKDRNTSYNESATKLSVDFLHGITIWHYVTCWQKELSVIFFAGVAVKITVFFHIYTPNVKPPGAMSLEHEATSFFFPLSGSNSQKEFYS